MTQHLIGQPVSVPDNSFGEEVFTIIQPESPITQLEAIPSQPIAVTWEKKPILTSLHSQVG